MTTMEDVYQGMDIGWYALDNEMNLAMFLSGGGLPLSVLIASESDGRCD
ncbi:hypothetical protein [Chitinophaga silvatica]|nr:hypothetical protein [Chitinophaga silvatica]